MAINLVKGCGDCLILRGRRRTRRERGKGERGKGEQDGKRG